MAQNCMLIFVRGAYVFTLRSELCFTKAKCKGQFTQAIFVAATRCNFCRAKVASSFKHVGNPCDIAATNRTENRTWFTRSILKFQL